MADFCLLADKLDFKFKHCKKCVLSGETEGSEALFLKAVTVWIKKPHVVNRRLCASKLISVNRMNSREQLHQFLRESVKSITHHISKHPSFEDLSIDSSLYTVVIRELIPKSEYFPKVLEVLIHDKISKTLYFIPIADGECSADGGDNSSYATKEVPYSVQFKCHNGRESSQNTSNEIVMSWSCDHEQPDVPKRQLSSKWLSTILLDKLCNWSNISDISTDVKSLQLVDVEKYQKTYLRLKNTYGRDLVKNWTESTDPKKFVYEDIAIASYLLLIWEEDRRMKNLQYKQSFVDMGCGNGLLVYILTREGHKGLGIDVRKRKIWDTFGSDVKLQESMIRPSSDHLFPDYDWLIGNHSDELTPWIPVIAARSSYKCCFFVLPCCHFDFVGKFTASEKGKSKYATYLNYVRDIISNCGFNPEIDTLRIPSTKKVSYIGRYKTYSKCEEEEVDRKRQAFIDMRSISKQKCGEDKSSNKDAKDICDIPSATCVSDSATPDFKLSSEKLSRESSTSHQELSENQDQSHMNPPICKKAKMGSKSNSSECDESASASQWACDFKPRVETIKVRNCQTVSSLTKCSIVDTVFNKVLAADQDNIVFLNNGAKWCKGGVVPLGQVVSLFDRSMLQELKSECGGLQTLLRNHGHIFQVSGGNVQLRDFTLPDPWIGRNPQKSKDKKQDTLKTTLCWFNDHHPDGCPKAINDCRYAHGQDDLRQKVVKKS